MSITSIPNVHNVVTDIINKNSSLFGLIGAAFLPHGAIILDPDKFRNDLLNDKNNQFSEIKAKECENLHEAMVKSSKIISETQPDLIILCTPHGIATDSTIGIYRGGRDKDCRRATGNAGWKGHWEEYSCDIQLCSRLLCDELILYMRDCHIPVCGLTMFGGYAETPLHWAEVIPLHFILKAIQTKSLDNSSLTNPPPINSNSESLDSEHSITATSPQVLICSTSLGASSYCLEENQERIQAERIQILSEFGVKLRSWCENLIVDMKTNDVTYLSKNDSPPPQSRKARVFVVASGDLAHSHSFHVNPSHNHLTPSGNFIARDEKSLNYDNAFSTWAASMDINALKEMQNSQAEALTCGFTSALFMHGLLTGTVIQSLNSSSDESIDSNHSRSESQQSSLSKSKLPLNWKQMIPSDSCPSGPFHPTYYGMMVSLYQRI